MNLHLPALSWAAVQGRLRGMFNLNDPKWGRGDDKPADASKPEGAAPEAPPPPPPLPLFEGGGGMGADGVVVLASLL